jgi:hypothetical protein
LVSGLILVSGLVSGIWFLAVVQPKPPQKVWANFELKIAPQKFFDHEQHPATIHAQKFCAPQNQVTCPEKNSKNV